MPSPPLLNFEELVAPIPGESPAGSSVPFAVREKLEDWRKEIDPASWAPNDPSRPAEFKRAEWAPIIQLSKETLVQSSKDLLVVARMTEALTREHGFAGFRDGFQLFRLLVEQAWNRVLPAIESEDDLEVRAAPFFWLDERDRGARFPVTIYAVPMVTGEKGPLSWQNWKDGQGGKGTITPADFEKAIQATPRDQCQVLFDDITLGWQELDTLVRELNEKMGRYAPGLTAIREALANCRSLAQQVLQKKGPAPSAPASAEGDGAEGAEGEADGGVAAGRAKRIVTRADVYERLAEAAALLQQMEPHSPVPYLIQRAIELGAMQFPDLMKNLVLNPDVIKSMNRELGIKEEVKK